MAKATIIEFKHLHIYVVEIFCLIFSAFTILWALSGDLQFENH